MTETEFFERMVELQEMQLAELRALRAQIAETRALGATLTHAFTELMAQNRPTTTADLAKIVRRGEKELSQR